MVPMAFPFDETPLWVLVCFLGANGAKDRLFEEGFGLDGKETLSVNSTLNESTSLWWTKTGYHTTSDWRRFSGDAYHNTHGKEHLSALEHRCGTNLKTLVRENQKVEW